ncbi:MAG: mannosyltransferase [Bacteroidia bacterium]
MKAIEKIPTWIVVTLLTVAALVLRLLYLNSTDIAGDEPFSIFVAHFDLSEIIVYLSTGNNPPLFEVLLHFYIRVFGDSDFTLRLFPAILSSLTVGPIFLIGRKFFNGRVALIASVLFIFSIYQIRFAHEVRVYSFFSFITAWTIYSFLSTLDRPKSIKLWAILVLCNLVLIYSHFTAFYILLTELVCGILFLPKTHWKFLFGSLALTGVLFAPYLLVFIGRLGEVSSAGTWVTPPGLGELYGSINLMLNHRLTTLTVITSVVLGLALSRKTSLLERAKELLKQRKMLALFVWFILPYSLMFLCSTFFVPMFIDRYILYTSIPLFLCVAVVVNEAWSKSQWPLVGVFLIGCGSIATTNLNPSNNRKVGEAVEFVKNSQTESAVIYLCPDHYDLAFTFHYNRAWFSEMANKKGDSFQALSKRLNTNGIFPIRDKNELRINDINRIIYLDADSKFVLPDNHILETLQEELTLRETEHFEQIFDVYVFDRVLEEKEVNPTQMNE